ncbi:MAG: ACT domain-containing protein [Clostridia bacterium]|nr:ACT domain-containing protein [Clostridia bacterium]NLS85591.1 ACT domain-containing protein [Oscillospiraceae bacterium]
MMEAVITVVGKDAVGILAKVCTACADEDVNVEEVTQRILRGTFAMIMIVDVTKCKSEITAFAKRLDELGKTMGVEIRCTRQELYDTMHRV